MTESNQHPDDTATAVTEVVTSPFQPAPPSVSRQSFFDRRWPLIVGALCGALYGIATLVGYGRPPGEPSPVEGQPASWVFIEFVFRFSIATGMTTSFLMFVRWSVQRTGRGS